MKNNNIFEKIIDPSEKMSMTSRFEFYESKFTKMTVSNEYPVIVRLDGHKFTKLTKKMKVNSPFSNDFDKAMIASAESLLKFSSADMALVGSDEISLIYKPRMDRANNALVGLPHDGRVEKSVSLLAGFLSVEFSKNIKPKKSIFNSILDLIFGKKENQDLSFFDARIFNIPEFEVLNYVMSRQISLNTNAVSQYADFYVGKSETFKMNSQIKIEMLKENGIDFEKECPDHVKSGTLLFKDGSSICKRLRRSEMDPELINKIEYKV